MSLNDWGFLLSSLSRDPRLLAALAWVTVALGSFAFFIQHLFTAIGGLTVDVDHGHTHDHGGETYAALADHNSSMSWQIAVFLLWALVPIILTLVSGSRAAAWTAMILGGLFVLGNVFDGFAHAVSDGAPAPAVVAVLGVGLPGVLGVLASLRWAKSAAVVDELVEEVSRER